MAKMEPDTMGKTDAEWVRIIGREFYGEAFRPEEFPDGFENSPTPDQAVMAAQLLGMGGFDEAAMRWFRDPRLREVLLVRRFEAVAAYLSSRRHALVLIALANEFAKVEATPRLAVDMALCCFSMAKRNEVSIEPGSITEAYGHSDASRDVAELVAASTGSRRYAACVSISARILGRTGIAESGFAEMEAPLVPLADALWVLLQTNQREKALGVYEKLVDGDASELLGVLALATYLSRGSRFDECRDLLDRVSPRVQSPVLRRRFAAANASFLKARNREADSAWPILRNLFSEDPLDCNIVNGLSRIATKTRRIGGAPLVAKHVCASFFRSSRFRKLLRSWD